MMTQVIRKLLRLPHRNPAHWLSKYLIDLHRPPGRLCQK